MGYLLVIDASRDVSFRNSAELFVKFISGQNKEKYNYIKDSELKDLGLYKN